MVQNLKRFTEAGRVKYAYDIMGKKKPIETAPAWADFAQAIIGLIGQLFFADCRRFGFLLYGSSAMQYSRWNHAYNATVRPLFYPWAVVIGIIMIILAVRKTH